MVFPWENGDVHLFWWVIRQKMEVEEEVESIVSVVTRRVATPLVRQRHADLS